MTTVASASSSSSVSLSVFTTHATTNENTHAARPTITVTARVLPSLQSQHMVDSTPTATKTPANVHVEDVGQCVSAASISPLVKQSITHNNNNTVKDMKHTYNAILKAEAHRTTRVPLSMSTRLRRGPHSSQWPMLCVALASRSPSSTYCANASLCSTDHQEQEL